MCLLPNEGGGKQKKIMQPGVAGSTDRPFFQQVPSTAPPPLETPLTVPTAIPQSVRTYYERFGADTEWYRGALTILSYNEAKTRTNDRYIDFAMRYAGMGHVEVFFADKKNGLVFSRMDGGANGFERMLNADRHANYRGWAEADAVDFDQILQSADAGSSAN